MKAVVVLTVLTLAGLGLAAAPAAAGDLKVGDQAPNFKLQATDGKTYQLTDFKGKEAVVLAWFPKAFTQGCTIECKSLAENGHLIEKYNAKYFMVSVDPLEGEKGNIAFAEGARRQQVPAPERSHQGHRERVRRAQHRTRLREPLDVLHRQDREDHGDRQGRAKRLATSAEDMAATLKQLGVEEKKK